MGDRPVRRCRVVLEGGRGRLPRPRLRPRRHASSRSSTPACRRTPGRSGSRCSPASRRWAPCECVPDGPAFAITDPLPTGTVLLEASAGTGKTWTIGALVTRYVVEGVARLEQMLVVTFGRAASQELRERVRAQLVEAERVLSDDPADRAAVATDTASELVTMLLALRRRAAPGGAPAGRRRAGRVRRGDDRHHPPVLLDGARLARGGRRLRLPGPAGRGPRRPGQGGRRRPLPAGLRARRGGTGVHLRRRARDRSPRGRRPAGTPRAGGRGPRHAGRPPGQLRARGARGDGPPQAPARRAVLRRPPQPARRRARGEGVAGGRTDAAAVADRAGRRVPGHRPGAVAGARPGVQRARHDGADRRPQAGHLRLPRRRRHDVPHRGRHRRDPADAVGQLAQRRRVELGVAGAAPRRRARRRADRGPRRRGPPHREPAGRGGQPVPGARGPSAGRVAAAGAADRRPGAPADRRRPRPRRTPPARRRRHVRRAAGAAPRHRGDQLPPRRPLRRPGRAPGGRCPRRDRRRRQRVRHPRGRRVADRARGPGAAAPQHPRALGGADLLLRPHRRRPRRAAATTSPTRWPRRCGRGWSCSAAAAWPP